MRSLQEFFVDLALEYLKVHGSPELKILPLPARRGMYYND